MNYLIDTSVIYELIKQKPDKNVIKWFKEVPAKNLYASVLSFGEIRKEIEKSTNKNQQAKLKLWLEHELTHWFKHRIIPIDYDITDCWGRLSNQSKLKPSTVDTLLLATAIQSGLAFVTEKKFKLPQLEVINPWDESL